MRVQHNIMALNANRNLGMNNSNVSKSLEKLSSGYRINRAADDAAGLAISEKMRAQISCLTQAETNCNDGISLIQTAEGALTEVHDMLNRMVELAEQSANGTYTDEIDRTNIQSEASQLKKEIDRISKATNFNGINLLDGSLGGYKATTNATNVNSAIFQGGTMEGAKALQVSVTEAGLVSFKIDGTANDTTKTGVSIAKTEVSKDEKGNDVIKLTFKYDRDSLTDATVNTDELKDAVEENSANYDGLTVTINRTTGKAVADQAISAADAAAQGLTLQIGDTSDPFNKLTVNVASMSTKGLSVDGVDISSQDGASIAVETIKTAINSVSAQRGNLGAMQNRLEHTVNNLSVTNENITNAESRIRDTDMAKEMMTYTSKNILTQAAQSMLAQANQQPQQVLSLLQ